MTIVKELFQEWKNHEVTKAFFSALENRTAHIAEMLQEVAGREPVEDARKSGYMLAVKDVLSTSVDDLGGNND